MIRKVYEVDPLLCPTCGGQMSIIAFIEDHKVIDKIIAHLKLTFMAERPPPPQIVQQELLIIFLLPTYLSLTTRFLYNTGCYKLKPYENFIKNTLCGYTANSSCILSINV